MFDPSKNSPQPEAAAILGGTPTEEFEPVDQALKRGDWETFRGSFGRLREILAANDLPPKKKRVEPRIRKTKPAE